MKKILKFFGLLSVFMVLINCETTDGTTEQEKEITLKKVSFKDIPLN